MTVQQLIDKLKTFPPTMQVYLHGGKEDEYKYGESNSVYSREITFCEDPYLLLDDQPWAKEEVVIIDEE